MIDNSIAHDEELFHTHNYEGLALSNESGEIRPVLPIRAFVFERTLPPYTLYLINLADSQRGRSKGHFTRTQDYLHRPIQSPNLTFYYTVTN
jgi:hypothetical protein